MERRDLIAERSRARAPRPILPHPCDGCGRNHEGRCNTMLALLYQRKREGVTTLGPDAEKEAF